MLNNSLSINQFLSKESCSSKHSKAAILEFLGLHELKLFWVLRLQAKRVKSKVTRGILRTDLSWLVNRDILGFNPSNLSTDRFSLGNSSSKEDPQDWGYLRQVVDSRSSDRGIPQKRLSFNSLSNKESNSGKHGNLKYKKIERKRVSDCERSWCISVASVIGFLYVHVHGSIRLHDNAWGFPHLPWQRNQGDQRDQQGQEHQEWYQQ